MREFTLAGQRALSYVTLVFALPRFAAKTMFSRVGCAASPLADKQVMLACCLFAHAAWLYYCTRTAAQCCMLGIRVAAGCVVHMCAACCTGSTVALA
eukprot:3968569-Alexandrium_andersonii.AAC.1